MNPGILRLAWRHALHHRLRTGILVACLAVTIFVPAATTRLLDRYRAELVARADASPLLAGASGSRFDLVMSTLYFQARDLETVPWRFLADLRRSGAGLAIPIHARFTARGHPIVATAPEYHERRGLRPIEGTLPLRIGDVVLGADVARALELGAGDHLFSDQRDFYDIAKPPALRMRVTGVLAPTNTPDDAAVFVDINTAWILEGIAHGHDDPERIEESLLLGRSEEMVVVSPAMIEYHEVTDENVASFHVHGSRDDLPLTAVLYFPTTDKDATLLKSETNVDARYQMVRPRRVIDDLFALVFRVKTLFDAVAGLLAVCTVLLTGLVILLSVRIRSSEFATLDRIGCGRGTVVLLHAAELGVIVAAALAVALGSAFALETLAPDLAAW